MKKHLDVFMFIDALGWEITERYDFMRNEFPERRRIAMQFGYSCTAIPTILTGERPEKHGHLSLFYYDPKHSPFKALKVLHRLLLPRSLWNRGRVRNILSRLVKKLLGFTGYFQLYRMPFERIGLMNYGEPRDIFAAGGLAPCRNLRDVLLEGKLKFHISDWHCSESENVAAAQTEIDGGATDFIFLYTAGFDALLHESVRNPDRIAQKLDWYTKKIDALLASARKNYASFTFTVISDHGMTPCGGTADIQGTVEKLGLKFGEDYAACYDSTMFRPYFLKPEAREKIMAAVSPEAFPGHWLRPEEKARYGLGADGKFGDEIFLLSPGIQIVPSDMGGKALNGMHGFAPEDKDSAAAILSTAPIPDDITAVADFFKLMKRRIDALSASDAANAK